MKKLILFIIAVVVISACEENKNINPGKESNLSKTTEQIIRSDNEFGFDLFKRVNSSYSEENNVFISPLSAALALAMTYNGSRGETQKAMEVALKKDGLDMDAINQGYKELMNEMVSADPQVILNIANSIWYRDNFQVLPEFIETNQAYYDAEVNGLDFNDESAKDIINGWVSDKTNEKITKIIDRISAENMMYLINAVYFNGIWKSKFNENGTHPVDFHPENGSAAFPAEMMSLTDTFNYFSNSIFQAIELPYGNDKYSMIILLPSENKKTADIVDELNPHKWASWMDALSRKKVILNIPRFKFDFERVLNDDLIQMGMGIAFSTNADFTGINPGGQLYISMVKQKAYIDVNENGTEAAAVTVVEISLTAMPGQDENIYFTANKPFVFVIQEKQTGSIVFIGKVAKPEYEQ